MESPIVIQNPSSSISMLVEGITKLPSFFTCSVLVLAFFAAFTRFMKIYSFNYRYQKNTTVIATPLFEEEDSDEDQSDDESLESDDESEYDYLSSDEDNDIRRFDDDFRVAGSDKMKLSHSWSDFVTGRNVVKSWDGLGLGLEKASESLISLWDLNKSEFTSFNSAAKYQIPALSMPSPSVIVSAGLATGKNVALRVFDTRLRRQIPQIFAEWQPCRRKVEDSGVVNEEADVGSVVVRDLRKMEGSVTESEVMRTWWDDGAVVIDGDREVSCLGSDNGSVVLRCRNAVFSSLL